jgi:mRNA-degrading endonuclease YafQ of YafQ-DinJ toxin-antitoxin module
VRKFLATETFWAKFYALQAEQKEQSRVAWEIFKANPFDPKLRTHKINALSGRAKKTVYAAVIESDLRVVFYIEGEFIVTIDIGSHDIYR